MNTFKTFLWISIACIAPSIQAIETTIEPEKQAWEYTYTEKFLTPWIYQDFDESMQTNNYTKEISNTTKVVGINGNLLYYIFKGLYNKNNLSHIVPSKQLKIPKIIHQIWIGSPVPNCFKDYMATWTQLHEGWTYKLWTDTELNNLTMHNRSYYDQTDNCGIKADIARLEILYQFGGVYIDTDFECLRPLDILNYTYDFYIGIQPLDTKFLQLNNALIGSRPGHPILKHCIETIKDDWHKKGAPHKTGPIHMTKSFFIMSDLYGNIDIALPAGYLYPLGCREKIIDKNYWTNQGAFGIHWWAKSWMPISYRPLAFKSIHNENLVHNWNT